jgi:uncharacterized protein involved in outer membrane biogenesis
MKKLIFRLLIALVVVIVLAVVALSLFLDRAIKAGIEAVGPKLTQTDIKLESVSLSLLSGAGKIKGLVVRNPEGFKTPSAIKVGTASLTLVPSSLLSDKIVVKSITVEGPEITFETDLHANNLSKILANLQAAAGGGAAGPAKSQQPAQTKEAKAAKKFEVDNFLITGGKVQVSVTTFGGKGTTLSLPEIRLQDLGKDSNGITAAELAKRVLEAIANAAAQTSSGTVADISKGALYITKDLKGEGTNTAEKVSKGIGNLLKRN